MFVMRLPSVDAGVVWRLLLIYETFFLFQVAEVGCHCSFGDGCF